MTILPLVKLNILIDSTCRVSLSTHRVLLLKNPKITIQLAKLFPRLAELSVHSYSQLSDSDRWVILRLVEFCLLKIETTRLNSSSPSLVEFFNLQVKNYVQLAESSPRLNGFTH